MPTETGADQPFTPPHYTIDLSLPAEERYKNVAAIFKTQLNALTGLWDQLLCDLTVPPSYIPWVSRCAKLVLRKVYDLEQTKELRGISEVTGIAMYLLVALNVVLDLLMGCTSGAVKTQERGEPRTQTRMLHFRTLDWTMDPLRRVVVQLDFVRSRSLTPLRILASSITYVGFVGVLTGVKQGLSLSLNFRGVHNAETKSAHFRFHLHHLLVLLGRRPSIASLLRSYLLNESQASSPPVSSPALVASDLQSRHTTAAYVILSDGQITVTMEKDYATARVQQSSSFIAVTNHDQNTCEDSSQPTVAMDASRGASMRRSSGLEDLIEESIDRLHCIQRKWDLRIRRTQKANNVSAHQNQNVVQNMTITRRDLIRWLSTWPTTNECTHYAAILDPSAGKISWSRVYPLPPQDPGE